MCQFALGRFIAASLGCYAYHFVPEVEPFREQKSYKTHIGSKFLDKRQYGAKACLRKATKGGSVVLKDPLKKRIGSLVRGLQQGQGAL